MISAAVSNVATAGPRNSYIKYYMAQVPTCDQVLDACNAYAGSLEVEKRLQAQQLTKQATRIVDLEASQPLLPRSVWAVIGALSGVLLWNVVIK